MAAAKQWRKMSKESRKRRKYQSMKIMAYNLKWRRKISGVANGVWAASAA